MADYNVDGDRGSDLNVGTPGAPFRTFQPINSLGWSGNRVFVNRGTRMLVNAATRANIEAAGGCTLDAYGDPLAARPIIDAVGATFNPVWVRSGSGIVIKNLHVTNAPADGIAVCPIAGQNISTVTLEDLLVTNNGLAGGLGVDGLKIGLAVLDGGTVTTVRAKRITARNNGGHGFKVRGKASDVEIRDSVSIGSGWKSPSHAMGTAGHFTDVSPSGWTLVSGTTYEKAVTSPLISSVTAWLGVWIVGGSPLYRLPFSATPSTPGAGECGIGAANTLRINLGGQNPSTLSSIFAVWAGPKQVWFVNCVGAETVDFNGLEGDGIYFDNGSENCYSIGCWGINNQGHAHYLNDNVNSGHYAGGGIGNLKGGASIVRGSGTNLHGNTYHCEGRTYGVNYSTGNANARARMNTIIGAATGMRSNDSGTNSVAEDENTYVACGTRLSQISSPGARSRDVTAVLPRAGNGAARAMALIEAARIAA